MSDALIRPATDADGRAIGVVLETVFAEYPGCLYEPGEFPELAAVASHFAARDGLIWVVERAGIVGGSCAVYRTADPTRFELAKVYLLAGLRGKGLAGRLLAGAVALARAKGGRALELFTDTRFHDAHRFYERHGFARLPGERFLGDTSDTWEYHYERAL